MSLEKYSPGWQGRKSIPKTRMQETAAGPTQGPARMGRGWGWMAWRTRGSQWELREKSYTERTTRPHLPAESLQSKNHWKALNRECGQRCALGKVSLEVAWPVDAMGKPQKIHQDSPGTRQQGSKPKRRVRGDRTRPRDASEGEPMVYNLHSPKVPLVWWEEDRQVAEARGKERSRG